MTSVGKGLDSLELPELHSFPQFSDTEAFILSKGFSSAATSQELSPAPLQLCSTPLVGWFAVVRMEMDFFPATLPDQQQLLLLYSPFPASFVVSRPEVWGSVAPRCLQGIMLPHGLEKSMVCFPLLPGPIISLVSLQNLQQIVVVKLSM